MKIQTSIQIDSIRLTEPQIDDEYVIDKNEERGKFFIWSENGYNSAGLEEYAQLDAAIREVKKKIKNYFLSRCEPNPKGW